MDCVTVHGLPDFAEHPVDLGSVDTAYNRRSVIRATYNLNGRTSAEQIYEAGSLRLRHPKGPVCEGVLVNTAGGLMGGDQMTVDIEALPAASVVLTSVAAEKVYRSERTATCIDTRLVVGPGSILAWVPQETILFNSARLRRSFEVEIAMSGSLIAAEMIVFGRVASGERDIVGSLRDSWRVRRNGRLVFADETRMEGPMSEILARAAVANGACAHALVLLALPEATTRLDAVRSAMDAVCTEPAVQGGASLKDGIIVARFVAQSGELVRRAVAAVIAAGGITLPRVWQ